MDGTQAKAGQKTEFKDTLNLPKTDFPIRPQAAVDDPAMIDRWQRDGLYQKAMELNQGKKTYILHDGPPYANGHIHLGHAYNKILKDIVTKAYRMSGYHVPVTPGWDCHGLPIELKVVQEQSDLSSLAIKQACRAYAHQWIDVQREEFKRLGVVMDWDHPYITMDYGYEAAILQVLSRLVAEGFIERKHKTVTWCSSCQTTLATAEIEYDDRKDPSIYTLFALQASEVAKLYEKHNAEPVYLLVWTTTPWTLPLNRAVAVKPKSSYCLIRLNGKLLIVGAALVDAIARMVNQSVEILQELPSEQLQGKLVQHPCVEGLIVPIVFDDFVSLEEGTACVHIAPGCGPADYELGIKNSLEIYSPITADGTYSSEIKPEELAGMKVADGQIWVIKKLAEMGMLFHKASIKHSYPHCWRCHQGLIFRATRQWFFDLQRDGIKEKALEAIDHVQFMPDRARNFLRATITNRWEWCLSRQRRWGVPIPALVCNACEGAFTDAAFIDRIAAGVAQQGIEYWDTVTISQLVQNSCIPNNMLSLSKNFACPSCGSTDIRKEQDILDVWFESGVSHYAVLYAHVPRRYPADLYLEGVDQFRGWFQSSLLTSLVLEGEPAMKAIMAHGFTVDAQGRKMSKSLGNVVAPSQLIERLGTDGLRLWVASIGNDSDAVASETLLANVAEVYRKIRNTCRFLLQNLYDFNFQNDMVPLGQLHYIDRIVLAQICEFDEIMRNAYARGEVAAVFHGLADFCTTQLSSLYLDIIKDRLYVERADGRERRSAQTVVWYTLDTLTKLMAPILSFTAEQFSDHYQKNKTDSIHLQQFADLQAVAHEMRALLGEYKPAWELFLNIRSALLKAIELQREQGVIKHSLEASVVVYFDAQEDGLKLIPQLSENLVTVSETLESFLQEALIISQVCIVSERRDLSETGVRGVYVCVSRALGMKCPRCWQWQEGSHPANLCQRCAKIVE